MEENKESFELYLLKIKDEASKLEPIKELYGTCPICGLGEAKLKISEFTHRLLEYVWIGNYYEYLCNNPACNSRFTTSQLDTFSLNSLKLQDT